MEQNPQGDRIPLIIEKIVSETADTKSFILRPVSGEAITYQPGQFLTLVFDKKDRESARRNYSISSSSFLQEPMQITVKRIPNGEFSRQLVDLAKEGDLLLTTGAAGFFTLPVGIHQYHRVFFFAAGSGITPIFSIIKTLLHRYPSVHIVLIYSNTSPDNAIFHQQLKDLQNQYYDRFDIEFLFSSSKSILHKRLGIYLLEKFLGKYLAGPSGSQLFYTCGPFEYMRMIGIVLRNHGISQSNIRREIFTVEAPVRKREPPDMYKHAITAMLHGREYSFDAQYPETILQGAKRLKIPLPYSCESGQCGTCAATCVSGKVWMWHNDVLMDEEIAVGRVLTCTGYAVEGDVILAY